jgi:hypothetical protein
VSIGLAIVTKYFVEDPVRRVRMTVPVRRWAFPFMAAGVAVIVAAAAVTGTNFRQAAVQQAKAVEQSLRAGGECTGAQAMLHLTDCTDPFAITKTVDPVFGAQDTPWGPNTILHDPSCTQAPGDPQRTLLHCAFGDTSAPVTTIALVGDSHAEQYLEPLVATAAARHWEIVPYVKPACSGLESAGASVTLATGARTADADCLAWGAAVQDDILHRHDIDVVVYTNQSASKPANATDTLVRWRAVEQSGKTVVAVEDDPNLPGDEKGPACVEASDARSDPCSWIPGSRPDFLADAVAAAHGSVPFISLDDLFCTADRRCHVVIGGLIAYYDNAHVSKSYAATIGPILADRIAEALHPAAGQRR